MAFVLIFLKIYIGIINFFLFSVYSVFLLIFNRFIHRQNGSSLVSSQKATALAAATFRESTPGDMGIFTV